MRLLRIAVIAIALVVAFYASTLWQAAATQCASASSQQSPSAIIEITVDSGKTWQIVTVIPPGYRGAIYRDPSGVPISRIRWFCDSLPPQRTLSGNRRAAN